jgi:hypothetical protein
VRLAYAEALRACEQQHEARAAIAAARDRLLIDEVYSQRFKREDLETDAGFDPTFLLKSYRTNPQMWAEIFCRP